MKLFQHYFQLVHLACQIQGWLLAGKTGDRVRPLLFLRCWASSSCWYPQGAWRSRSGGSQMWMEVEGYARACPEVCFPQRMDHVCA